MWDLCGFYGMVNDWQLWKCSYAPDIHCTHNICNLTAILQGWCDPSFTDKEIEIH